MKKKPKKVILELYLEIWHCYEDGKSMAYPLFTCTELHEAEAICRERKYEVIQMIDLENENLEEQSSDPEPGAAQICITLEDSIITVRHTDKNGLVLFEKEAVAGDWDRIWEAIRQTDYNPVKVAMAHYLCNDSEELDDIIEELKAADHDDLLENIEGICVWEKIEYEFSVGEFRKLIGL